MAKHQNIFAAELNDALASWARGKRWEITPDEKKIIIPAQAIAAFTEAINARLTTLYANKINSLQEVERHIIQVIANTPDPTEKQKPNQLLISVQEQLQQWQETHRWLQATARFSQAQVESWLNRSHIPRAIGKISKNMILQAIAETLYPPQNPALEVPRQILIATAYAQHDAMAQASLQQAVEAYHQGTPLRQDSNEASLTNFCELLKRSREATRLTIQEITERINEKIYAYNLEYQEVTLSPIPSPTSYANYELRTRMKPELREIVNQVLSEAAGNIAPYTTPQTQQQIIDAYQNTHSRLSLPIKILDELYTQQAQAVWRSRAQSNKSSQTTIAVRSPEEALEKLQTAKTKLEKELSQKTNDFVTAGPNMIKALRVFVGSVVAGSEFAKQQAFARELGLESTYNYYEKAGKMPQDTFDCFMRLMNDQTLLIPEDSRDTFVSCLELLQTWQTQRENDIHSGRVSRAGAINSGRNRGDH